MPLQPGTRLGPHEILEAIGAGGMGEVYRARDTKLNRDVAIKVLLPAVANDPEQLRRFEREAHLLASLNHPNVAAIYGFEEAHGIAALVLELVEGPTVAERIASGPLAIDEALAIARQIADALETAHDRGIVHRDLKPANVKVTADGTVKVLDFGIAKAVQALGVDAPPHSEVETAFATREGIIAGTAPYMSPEQVRGKPVDKRADIWAFGCVLYEMLTGRAPFPGQTLSDTIAAILSLDPDWRVLPEATPTQVRTLLQRCLEKDPRQRLRDIGDARIELDTVSVSRTPSPKEDESAEQRGSTGKHWTWRRGLAFAGGVVLVVALTFISATWLRPRAEAPAGSVHMTALLPPGVSVTRGPGMLLSLALSPDGRTLVIAGTDANGQRLYQRTLNRLEATALAGTEGALSPFFSPDGAWIGFFADRHLKRVPAGGGAAVEIAAAPGFPAGASWGIDDRIVFAGFQTPLRVVDARGGTPDDLTTLGPGLGHLHPEVLPDGRTVLFNEGGWIHALDLATRRRTDRLVEGIGARYAASGHLVLSRGTTLLAAPFDSTRLKLTGPVVPVVEGVEIDRTAGGSSHVAVSRIGTLAYLPAARAYALVLVEPDGTERVLSEHPQLENPRFSPNGRQLVVAATRRAGERPELWMHDLPSVSPASRLTFDGGRAPVWTPDGASVTYSHPLPSDRSGIYTRAADGGGDARPIVRLPNFHWLVGWTPKRTLLYGMIEDTPDDGAPRSSILAIEGTESRRVVGPGQTWGGRLSPDGRWLCYYARDSGYFEIYVTPIPNTGTRSLIAEGTDPAWSPDGSEIYYRNGSRLMAARIDPGSGIRVLSRRLVIEPFTPPLYDDYDIHPNGRTLALVRPAGDARGREITLVLNWLTELQRLMRQ